MGLAIACMSARTGCLVREQSRNQESRLIKEGSSSFERFWGKHFVCATGLLNHRPNKGNAFSLKQCQLRLEERRDGFKAFAVHPFDWPI